MAKSADTKFKAYILLHGKQVYLGHYSDENQAARAADTAKIYKVQFYTEAAFCF